MIAKSEFTLIRTQKVYYITTEFLFVLHLFLFLSYGPILHHIDVFYITTSQAQTNFPCILSILNCAT